MQPTLKDVGKILERRVFRLQNKTREHIHVPAPLESATLAFLITLVASGGRGVADGRGGIGSGRDGRGFRFGVLGFWGLGWRRGRRRRRDGFARLGRQVSPARMSLAFRHDAEE